MAIPQFTGTNPNVVPISQLQGGGVGPQVSGIIGEERWSTNGDFFKLVSQGVWINLTTIAYLTPSNSLNITNGSQLIWGAFITFIAQNANPIQIILPAATPPYYLPAFQARTGFRVVLPVGAPYNFPQVKVTTGYNNCRVILGGTVDPATGNPMLSTVPTNGTVVLSTTAGCAELSFLYESSSEIIVSPVACGNWVFTKF